MKLLLCLPKLLNLCMNKADTTTNLTFHLLPQMELEAQVGGDSHHLIFY